MRLSTSLLVGTILCASSLPAIAQTTAPIITCAEIRIDGENTVIIPKTRHEIIARSGRFTFNGAGFMYDAEWEHLEMEYQKGTTTPFCLLTKQVVKDETG